VGRRGAEGEGRRRRPAAAGAAGRGGEDGGGTGTHSHIYTPSDTFHNSRKKHCGCTHVGDTFAGMDFSLANLDHLELFFLILLSEGSLCPKCGHGTRVLSKGWAKCKECGG